MRLSVSERFTVMFSHYDTIPDSEKQTELLYQRCTLHSFTCGQGMLVLTFSSQNLFNILVKPYFTVH